MNRNIYFLLLFILILTSCREPEINDKHIGPSIQEAKNDFWFVPGLEDNIATPPGDQIYVHLTDEQGQLIIEKFVYQAGLLNLIEIALSQIAEERATYPEVKELASTIIQDHRQMQQQLRQIVNPLQQQRLESINYQLILPDTLMAEDFYGLPPLVDLHGPNFDRAYVTMIMGRHKRALQLYQAAAAAEDTTGLNNFAKAAIPFVRTHLRKSSELGRIFNPEDDRIELFY